MCNIIAGILRRQLPYTEKHIEQKKAIWERYEKGLADLPVQMNSIFPDSVPNYWLSCIINPDAIYQAVRSEKDEL